jgi:hypothetical protein
MMRDDPRFRPVPPIYGVRGEEFQVQDEPDGRADGWLFVAGFLLGGLLVGGLALLL